MVHREDGTAFLNNVLPVYDAVVEKSAGEKLRDAVAELVMNTHGMEVMEAEL